MHEGFSTSCGPSGVVLKYRGIKKMQESLIHRTAEDIKEVIDNTVEVSRVKEVNEISMEATLAHSKQFKLKFKMIWTFKIKFKCKVDGDLCELEVRVDDDLKEHKISELGKVEVDSAMNSEVAKVDASLAPPIICSLLSLKKMSLEGMIWKLKK